MLDPNQIRQAREALSLSQRELARRANISRTALNQLEQGKGVPGFHFSRKLRDFFDAEGIDVATQPEPLALAARTAAQETPTAIIVDAEPEHAPGSAGADDDLSGAIVMLLGLGLSILLGRRIGS